MELTTASKNRCYDNTKVSSYKDCPRRYFLRHVQHWTVSGEGKAAPLIFGSSWHDAQDIVWGQAKNFNQRDLTELAFGAFQMTWEEHGMPIHPTLEQQQYLKARTPMIAKEMLYNYIDRRWSILQQCDVIGIEQPFAVPVPGLEGVWYVGRLDKAIEHGSQRLIIEHKSTTAYSIDYTFLLDYVESWSVSAQVKGYQWGGSLFYNKIDAVWVDAALVHKKVHDGFKFIPVAHSPDIMVEWVLSTKGWITQIIAEEEAFELKKELTPGMFKKNEESCFGKYGSCPFLDICRTISDPTKLSGPPPGFVEEKWEPFDVLGLDKLIKQP